MNSILVRLLVWDIVPCKVVNTHTLHVQKRSILYPVSPTGRGGGIMTALYVAVKVRISNQSVKQVLNDV